MAARKKREVTPEERLEAALIPTEKWPYKVSHNWCWVNVGTLAKLHRGVSYKKPDVQSTPGEKRVLILRGGNIGDGFIDTEADNVYVDKSLVSPSQIIRKGDIVIVASTGSTKVIGRAGISGKDYTDVAFGAFLMLVRPINEINQEYLGYYFQSMFYRNRIRQLAAGVNINNIRADYITSMPIALPPLPEQRRIASRIEWLFAKLDDAEAKLHEVINSSEQRQAAILHKAFEGELTASWRNENHLSRDSWKRAIIKDVCRDVKVGIVIKPSQYYTDENDGTRAFRSANVREFRIEDSDWVYINDEGMSSNQRSVVHTGDVLIVRSGNPGTACVVDETFDGCNAIDILIAVPDKAIVTPDYLCAFTNSPAGKALVAQNKRGMALMHFNVKSYSALEIPLPTIEEQQVIVSKLFRMLDSERSVKGCAEVVLANIEMIRSSILAKALRGELGTNDPDEPSSKELLASVFEREA